MTDERRKAFFFYQQGMSGIWSPVIVFDDKPVIKDNRLVVEAVLGPPATDPVELNDEDFILTSPEDFYTLKKKYPRKEF